ncbi:potassium-transporting ATPase subunit C [Actinomadura flavalba]|uniref:potassium-transporting ATPase subunit C n=1 Tax=Actinomadura flavalba TaxID=1120938 RepID=UPI000362573A|nr:potassium-transporting ATPase subunit C [Actinomadura flavalba]
MNVFLRRHLAAVRALLVLTLVCGLAYPLAVTAVAQLPGLDERAAGSPLRAAGRTAGSTLIGQAFTGPDGAPLRQYFQGRPSAAGDGYDASASGASNLGPEDVVDAAPGAPSLLSTVCARSRAVGALEGVSGARPYCAPSGAGAVLAVFGPRERGRVTRVDRVVSVNEYCPTRPFTATYRGVRVECRKAGEDVAAGRIVPVRGDAPARPAVPADAVTASGSGLDPHVSPAYARLQAARVAAARHLPRARVDALVAAHTTRPALGLLGAPVVNVVTLNAALDRI